jgi:hypothetical protein
VSCHSCTRISKPRHIIGKCIFALLMAFSSFRCEAQALGSIRGQVFNLDHEAIKGAQIELLRVKKVIGRTATNDDGVFMFDNIPLGAYNLTVTALTYVPKSVGNVQVTSAPSESITVFLEDRERGPENLQDYISPGPQWNIWVENYSTSAQFLPIKKLLKNKTYLLIVNLTGIDLKGKPGVYSSAISPEFSKTLDKDARKIVPIDVLVLPEGAFFDPPTPRIATVPINVGKIRAARNRKFSVSQDLLDYLRQNPQGPLVYGEKEFSVRTKDETGTTFIALSFWVDGKVPVDEAVLPVCVVESESDECPTKDSPVAGFMGIDSVRTAMQRGELAYPDAAVHFVEAGSRSVVGIFRCNVCTNWSKGQFMAWELGDSAQELQYYLAGTVLKDFEDASNRKAFLDHGEEFFNTLFPPTASGQAQEARDAFVGFVRDHWNQMKPTPSVFIRLLPQEGDPLFLIPFGLIVPPGYQDFLGFHFRVETPLENQNYETPQSCIANWTLLVPDSKTPDDALRMARAPFASNIRSFRAWNGHATVYDRLDEFRNWAKAKGDQRNTAVLILSHHDANRLYFLGNDALESKGVSRHLKPPSVVILNACGTGSPGAWDFVRKFNSNGASAAIATSISVEANMAGLFLMRLMEELKNDEPLGQAKFDAALAVSKMNQPAPNQTEKYGPRILIYVLAGNGGLTLCTPAGANAGQSLPRHRRQQ